MSSWQSIPSRSDLRFGYETLQSASTWNSIRQKYKKNLHQVLSGNTATGWIQKRFLHPPLILQTSVAAGPQLKKFGSGSKTLLFRIRILPGPKNLPNKVILYFFPLKTCRLTSKKLLVFLHQFLQLLLTSCRSWWQTFFKSSGLDLIRIWQIYSNPHGYGSTILQKTWKFLN